MSREHSNPSGVYRADCEGCAKKDVNCQLVMVEDRYRWFCVTCKIGGESVGVRQP